MLIIARTTGVQTVVMNGDRLVTHESYGSNTRVLVGMGKQKCLWVVVWKLRWCDGADATRRSS